MWISILLNFIGFTSAVSLVMIAVLFFPYALQGNFHILQEFFQTYPGSEPFVIFMFPVILIGGAAWIGRSLQRGLMKIREFRTRYRHDA
ncbi:MAG: hypothetical protein NC930_02535 [Candidatus Omnitrophica bacterium]|nr:hypothetical protein [Candidatus Omnitrophota bacterium]